MTVLPKTEALFQLGLEQHWHLGAQLFISRDGQVIADRALGEARPGLPMRADQLVPWLSAGKPFAAVAVAQLVEQARMHWDDPVARYIPEFAPRGKHAITLRHLLTHTGGFRSAEHIALGTPHQQMLERICAAPLEPRWVPGEKAGYQAQASWFLLGEIVQRVTGLPFDQYVRQRIFIPLGMNDSWFALDAETAMRYGERIAYLYTTSTAHRRLFEHSPRDLSTGRPGSSGRGPARELGRFYQWLLAARDDDDPARDSLAVPRLLRPDTVRLLTSPQRVGLFDHTFRHVIDCGLGFILNSNRYGADTVPYGYGRHASEGTFGHSGAQSSCAFADPAHGLVVAWVCNGRPGEERHQHRARALNSAIYEDLLGAG